MSSRMMHLTGLREEMARHPRARMQIPPEQGQFMRLPVLLRPGGLILIDNVLWSGRVIRLEDKTRDTVALRALNRKLHGDERVSLAMLAIGDGLTIARKRPSLT